MLLNYISSSLIVYFIRVCGNNARTNEKIMIPWISEIKLSGALIKFELYPLILC